ncbi:heptosyltransferase-2/heptosyltransferase-3 [Orenia metallireducens]|jgi:heptosyltransferase-2/heptosyltransferase-3|uniref:lipopolysaccharide heptosyltransferase II n=1 Tax=Orenia metallireducens TaxID=1413210 RepID=A0A285GLY0_9FIRM|nr:lipopolysaccharide heptosyltransferase II [Orenia metallireducens]PRX35699.1 heptosyltransferase-2/heptosyltransferase-3 [Orenia metallireducens]SNY24455.1 heptosyltransferase-2/heptosyltransferase-3 [Orenia metallireducens]
MNDNISNANRILIIDLLYLGDLIFVTPFIRNLREKFPTAQIDMVVNSNFFDIMEENSYLDQVYAYNKNWSIKKSWKFARRLSQNNYELGLNLHGNWRTALLLKVINPAYTIGFGGKGRGIWLNQELLPAKNMHMVDVYLNFLAEIGFESIDNQGVELEINQEASKNMLNFLQEHDIKDKDRVVGLNTGGSWPTKQWTKEGFAQLGDRLEEELQAKVIFFGGPGDVERVNEIVAMMKTKPIIATGKTTLKELAALAARCNLFISGDTGPVHVAAAVGIPTIALFGPSDEQKYRPYGEKHKVIENGIDCRPCGHHHCPLEHHKCLEEISADDVLRAVMSKQ